MKSSSILTNPTLQTGIRKYGTKLISGVALLFVLLFAGTVSAQTVRQSLLTCSTGGRDACTSNDLYVVSVDIVSSGCVTCSGGSVTLPLSMTIHNNTGSVRTSFALYGTLSPGAKITSNGVDYSGNVFICVGPITVTQGDQTFPVGNITFTCGQDLTLTNNFLKWTDASGSTVPRCEELALKTSCLNGPDGIGPKCGFAPSITINGPVPAPTHAKDDPTCTVSTGKVRVTSSTTGFTFSIDGGPFTAYPTGGWTVTANQQHCVVAKRTSDGCNSPQSCITIPAAPATPDAPTVCIVQPTLCGSATGSAKITAPTGTGYQYSKDNGTTWQDCNVFLGLAAGSNPTFKVKSAGGCISAATPCTSATICSETPTDCSQSVVKKADIQNIELAAPKTSIQAAPNPFNDRIRFTLKSKVSGQGSLELYNIMGQKVKSVFQGYVNADQPQTIEYAVPYSQRSSMIYLFRVGNEKTTGKLVGMKQ